MTQIVLSPEQVKLYHQATAPVQLCDLHGKVLGTLPPEFSAEFIAEQKRRAASPGPWYSGEDVQAMFRSLEAAEAKTGCIDKTGVKVLVDEFEARHGHRS